MGDLKPLSDQLPKEVRELAEALRELFDGLAVSVRRYAARRARDAGTFSRYLNGTRVPPWEVSNDLFTDLAAHRGAPPRPETMELLRTLHHRAVRATPSPKHGVAVLESQLAEADRESRLSKSHKDVLGEALLDRQHRIADLEVRLNQVEADWGAERARANALAEAAPDIEGLLRERDELREEVRRLQSEVRETELRRAQAEERCALLERQLRSLEETAETEEEGGKGEVLPQPGSGRGARRMPWVLLVDDNLNNRMAMKAVLDSLDQEIVAVSSGREALKELLDADDFAVILLDVQMPGMDGYETAAHIKRRPRTREIPIIFPTAMGPDDSARGYAAGAVDYLAKPFDPWVLRAKVAVFTGIHLERNQRSNR
ncbi:PleD family two-component system response regulator [Streptomyces sp. RK75]|uniref:response regulator n=1 Tax=Streptomyces sp. RK75 TaxID=2824895 RepID=UPI001B371735|nr:response regulator [Streptomyces sp. RK75]MBQ0867022.1 response regulator [Streptomyces sp. RK75]